jgi:endonuclease/exonuclease/phosphatase family metal-dependent hydrolase
MGDFNDSPGSPLYQMLTAPETGLTDTWEKSGGGEGPDSFTHHGFKGVPQQSRMDWILASSHLAISDAVIIRDNENGAYPSDHFPYLVEVQF